MPTITPRVAPNLLLLSVLLLVLLLLLLLLPLLLLLLLLLLSSSSPSAPMGSPSHGGGVSRLSLPTPFSPIFVCPSAYWNLPSVLLFTHQLLPTYLQFSSSDCPSCLHRPFAYISLLYKPSFATSLFLCGPLETRHVDRVPLLSYRLNSPTPTADQVEEENLQLPTVVKAEEGNTLLQVKAVGQMVLASPERQTVYAMETQNTNPGRMDPPAR